MISNHHHFKPFVKASNIEDMLGNVMHLNNGV